MIKFLQRIRRKLVEQGKLKNYMVYAIGEIVLVMVGILLALQVNTWNENRKAEKQEIQILKDIETEFLTNLESLKFGNERATVLRGRCSGLLQYTGKDVSELTRRKSDSLIIGLRNHTSLELTNYHLDELINTGKINLIKNDSLKSLLTNWTKDVIEDTEYEKLLYQENSSLIIPFLIENYSLATSYYEATNNFKSEFRDNYHRVFGLEVFENIIIRKIQVYNYTIDGYKHLEQIANTIIRISKEELKIKNE
jgi:hypothetical protein